jgi:hypothetical protein
MPPKKSAKAEKGKQPAKPSIASDDAASASTDLASGKGRTIRNSLGPNYTVPLPSSKRNRGRKVKNNANSVTDPLFQDILRLEMANRIYTMNPSEENAKAENDAITKTVIGIWELTYLVSILCPTPTPKPKEKLTSEQFLVLYELNHAMMSLPEAKGITVDWEKELENPQSEYYIANERFMAAQEDLNNLAESLVRTEEYWMPRDRHQIHQLYSKCLIVIVEVTKLTSTSGCDPPGNESAARWNFPEMPILDESLLSRPNSLVKHIAQESEERMRDYQVLKASGQRLENVDDLEKGIERHKFFSQQIASKDVDEMETS